MGIYQITAMIFIKINKNKYKVLKHLIKLNAI